HRDRRVHPARRLPISEIVQLNSPAAVMTDEEGTVSGELDVTLDEAGKGLVRYRGTDTWLTIGNLDGEPAHAWDSVARLAAAIETSVGERDAAGNTIPFEVFSEEDPAHANPPVGDGPSPDSGATLEGGAATPDATTPDATTPDATTPDATAPEATAPDATAPEADTPPADGIASDSAEADIATDATTAAAT